MLGHRTLTLEDYLTILKRRWPIIAIPAVILPIIALAISYRITPVYTSQTLVLIEQQKVPDSYVKPVVNEDIDSRLASMQEQILSRSRLEPIIKQYNLGDPRAMMDDRIDAVRKDIKIKTIRSESGTGGLPGFFISFAAGDPHTAQAVCREITSLFITENLKARDQSAEGTTEFLSEQVNAAKANLDAQDAKLAAFQRENLGALPDDQTGNMNMMSTLSSQLDATTQEEQQLEQQRSILEAMLAQQGGPTIPELSTNTRTPAPKTTTPQATEEQAKELASLQAQETELSARYTADYPDVVSIKRQIQDLKKEIAQNGTTGTSTTVGVPPVRVESPAVQQLRLKIEAIDGGIQQKRREQSNIQREMGMYQGRVAASPLVAAKYKELSRDYQTELDNYNGLLTKLQQAKEATDLERQQQGEQFRLMDDANLPDAPTWPKRSVFAAGGLFGALALGLLVVAFLEYRDKSLRTERDVWAFTKLPTLGIVAMNGATAATTAPRWWRRKPKVADQPLVKVGG
jgi:polysaccharide chain length determinant protein (PEP-CTERM system associated)